MMGGFDGSGEVTARAVRGDRSVDDVKALVTGLSLTAVAGLLLGVQVEAVLAREAVLDARDRIGGFAAWLTLSISLSGFCSSS